MSKGSTEILADYIENINYKDLPKETVQKAKNCILDSLACAFAGYRTEPSNIIVGLIKHFGGRPESTLIGDGNKVASPYAAYANSMMSNALDYDDTFVGHPGSTIIPPAVAVGEAYPASGIDLITSVILGYEVSLRIGSAIQPSKERMNLVWGLGTWQTFGSVTVATKLLSLKGEEILDALGIAGANAPVPSTNKTVFPPTMVKNNFGVASEVGVTAALLAKRGFSGPHHILDGDKGFWRMYGSDECNFDLMTKSLGEEYEILKVAFKPYPCCRWLHSAIDASLKIIEENEMKLDNIRRITVKTSSYIARPKYANPDPNTMNEAIVSMPYAISAAVTGVKRGIDWYTEETMKNQEILKFARKIFLTSDPEADRIFPPRNTAIVEIIYNGRRYASQVNYSKGEPENPMSQKELEDKFKDVATPVIGMRRMEKLKMIIDSLEGIENLSELTTLLYH